MTELKTTKISGADRIFVIADIHGHCKHLQKATTKIFGLSTKSKNNHVIFLGDYVDRGPDVKGTIQELIDFKRGYEKEHGHVHFLRGNHEGMFLHYLGLGGMFGDAYLAECNGGLQTFQSYGYTHRELCYLTNEEIVAGIGSEHINFIKDTVHYVESEEFLFVHAGFDPEKSLQDQTEVDVTWIRDKWIQAKHSFGKFVFHGHTRVPNPSLDIGYKMNLDTILESGFLSMAIINSGRVAAEKIEIDRIEGK